MDTRRPAEDCVAPRHVDASRDHYFIFSKRAARGYLYILRSILKIKIIFLLARLVILFYFFCSADHERDWPPCIVTLAVTTVSFGMYVCMYVFFPFILDIKFVGRTSRSHTGGRPHRILYPPFFCGACLNFSHRKDSAIPFPRRS